MRNYWMRVFALCAGVVTLLAGCAAGGAGHASQPSSASEAEVSPAQIMLLAATKAQQVTSFTATINTQGTGGVQVTMAGTLQERTKPNIYFDAAFSTVSFDGQPMPGGMEEILTNKALYLKMALLSHLTGGKPWAEVTLSDFQHASGVNLEQLIQQVESNNPLQQTEMLSASKDVRKIGTETINGVPTTHYTGAFPLSAGLVRLPVSVRVATSQMYKGSETEHFDVWLDAQQQVRKIVTSMGVPGQTATATMYVTAINNPVKTVVPPASEVTVVPASTLTRPRRLN
jgi:hypothetical protein